MAKNVVEQIVKLVTNDYSKGHKELRNEAEKTQKKVSEEAKKTSENHRKSQQEIQSNAGKTSKMLGDFAKKFKENTLDNIYKGSVVAGATALAAGVKSSVSDAKKSILDLDKVVARMGSRFDLSADKLSKMRKEFNRLGKETGVNSGDIAVGGELLFKNKGNIEGIDSIAKASAIGDMSAGEITRGVVDYLKAMNKDLSEGNISETLTSVSAMTRSGDLNYQEALSALTQNAASKNKLGLSDRESAGLIAGATSVGQDREVSVSGINAILSKSAEGFFADSGLGAMLGIKGGFTTDGKFDLGKLKEASQSFNSQGFSKSEYTKLLQGAGLSGDEAEGLYSILSQFDKFEGAFKKTVNDNKSLNEAFEQETDNLGQNLKKFNQSLSKATDEVLGPWSKVASNLLQGKFGKAASGSIDAIGESASGVMDNKAAIATGLGALALGGMLSKKLGLFGGNAIKGQVKSKAFEAATGKEVQNVFLINPEDIAAQLNKDGALSSLKAFKDGKIGQVLGRGANKALGLGKSVMGRLGPAAGVGAAAYVGYKAGEALEGVIDSNTQGKSSDGAFEGNIVERLFYKLDSLFGGDNAKVIQQANQQANKIHIELEDRTGRFGATATSADLKRN